MPEIVDRAAPSRAAPAGTGAGVDVAARLGAVAPTLVQSDVRAAAFAEAHVGAGDGLECFVYVMIDAGISAVIVRHGIPWAGRCGAALVLGVPAVEDVAGATALARLSGTTRRGRAGVTGLRRRGGRRRGASRRRDGPRRQPHRPRRGDRRRTARPRPGLPPAVGRGDAIARCGTARRRSCPSFRRSCGRMPSSSAAALATASLLPV